MATVLYLAMKEEEFIPLVSPTVKSGWFDCFFSQFDSGLDQLPSDLPPDSLLILTDRLPFQNHDTALITQQLTQTVISMDCAAVLLDFEQPSVPELESFTKHLSSTLPCPVVVSSIYVNGMDCPVFLPPCPHHIPLAEYIRPWAGRDIWLDLARNAETITVSAAGSIVSPASWSDLSYREHEDNNLYCHYSIQIDADCVRFHLRRTHTDMNALLTEAETLGVKNCVALYQEWANK